MNKALIARSCLENYSAAAAAAAAAAQLQPALHIHFVSPLHGDERAAPRPAKATPNLVPGSALLRAIVCPDHLPPAGLIAGHGVRPAPSSRRFPASSASLLGLPGSVSSCLSPSSLSSFSECLTHFLTLSRSLTPGARLSVQRMKHTGCLSSLCARAVEILWFLGPWGQWTVMGSCLSCGGRGDMRWIPLGGWL